MSLVRTFMLAYLARTLTKPSCSITALHESVLELEADGIDIRDI